jgi:hypothetical protein
MIIFFLTLINIFVLYTGIYIAVKNISTIDFNPLLRLASIVILFTFISFIYYLTLVFGKDFFRLLIFLSMVNLVGLFAFWNSFVSVLKIQKYKQTDKNDIWALFAIFIFTVYFFTSVSKYGGWDAITLWNLKAKFLYYPEFWKNQFASSSGYLSKDYPLMVPAIIAFFWSGVHSFTPFVPMLFAFGVMLVIPLLVYNSLLIERLNLFAYASLIIFIIDNIFKTRAGAQEADSLFSLFILLVMILYKNLKQYSDNQVYLFSFICASSAWVKNEGIVFFLLFTIGFVLMNFKNFTALKKYSIGAVIPLLILISFKLLYSPTNVIVAANSHHGMSVLKELTHTSSYITIGKFIFTTIFHDYLLLVVLMIIAIMVAPGFFKTLPFIVIALLLLSYWVAYLVAPADINWLLDTSCSRITQHVYPALIYLLFLSIGHTVKGNYKLNVA